MHEPIRPLQQSLSSAVWVRLLLFERCGEGSTLPIVLFLMTMRFLEVLMWLSSVWLSGTAGMRRLGRTVLTSVPSQNSLSPVGAGRLGPPTRLYSDRGHQSTTAMPKLSEEEERLVAKFREQQQKAARPTMAEQVRTLLDRSLCYGTLSTNSVAFPGFPTGSVVGFELDEAGLPFFYFSTMSAHTHDVIKDGRVSLTVLASDFKGAEEGRLVLIGTCKKLSADAELQAKLKERYLARHKGAFWIDFGDFSCFQMESLQAIRYVGGFAMAGSVTPEEYQQAKPDPLAAFAAPVIKHMNDDHADSTAAMVRHYTGVPCSSASIVSMDRLGMTVKANLEIGAASGVTNVRLPYPDGPVTERKAIKEALVAMTRASSPPPPPSPPTPSENKQ